MLQEINMQLQINKRNVKFKKKQQIIKKKK